MKKLLWLPLFTLFAVVGVKAQDTAVSQTTDFIDIVQKQKNGWLDYKQKMTSAEFDLLKKHHNEMFDMKKQYLQKYQPDTNMDQFMQSALGEKLAMYKRHMNEWKALCEQYQKMGQDLFQQYQAEVAKFEQSLGGATASNAATTALPGSEE